MSSPTPGSFVPPVDKEEKKKPLPEHQIIDGIPKGYIGLDVTNTDLDARVKCTQCEVMTLHVGFAADTLTSRNERVNSIRVYACTVCGHLSTKKA